MIEFSSSFYKQLNGYGITVVWRSGGTPRVYCPWVTQSGSTIEVEEGETVYLPSGASGCLLCGPCQTDGMVCEDIFRYMSFVEVIRLLLAWT
jgi:hypothetical protein